MENTEMNETPSYWNSVLIASLITAAILTVMGTISQYMTISSEPTGSSFGAAQLVGILVCLIGAIGGILATRHYAKQFDITFTLGKGAVIGLLTGLIAVIFSTILGLLWNYVIDPGLAQAVYDWQIANLEANPNLTAEMVEQQIAFIPEPGSTTAMITQFGIGLVMFGILNLLTGLIGAKVFASEE